MLLHGPDIKMVSKESKGNMGISKWVEIVQSPRADRVESLRVDPH